MEVRRKYLIGVTFSVLVGLLFGLYGLFAQTQSYETNGQGLPGYSGPAPVHPVTVNTIDYASKVVGDKIITPDASRVGPGYRIIGVDIMEKPRMDTTSGGFSWRHWVVAIIISDMPFVNGTTLSSFFKGHWIVVSEGSAPGILNSHDDAMSNLAPSYVCQHFDNGSQSCTQASVRTGQVIQIRNTWLYIYPGLVPVTSFTMDGVKKAVTILGDLSHDQMLALADSVIP